MPPDTWSDVCPALKTSLSLGQNEEVQLPLALGSYLTLPPCDEEQAQADTAVALLIVSNAWRYQVTPLTLPGAARTSQKAPGQDTDPRTARLCSRRKSCDHFSYSLQPESTDLRKHLQGLSAGSSFGWVEDTVMGVGWKGNMLPGFIASGYHCLAGFFHSFVEVGRADHGENPKKL